MKKYVLAVDIGKGKSKIGLFGVNTQTMQVETILKPKDYAHSEEELGCLLTRIGDRSIDDIGVMMKSAYVYQSPLIVFFRRHGFTEISVINPLKIKKAAQTYKRLRQRRSTATEWQDSIFSRNGLRRLKSAKSTGKPAIFQDILTAC